jgi:hypothetical protein
LRSSPTVFAETPMPRSASTCIASGSPPSATWSAAMLLGLYRIVLPPCFPLGENNRALQMKSIADRKVPKFRKAFTPGKFPEGHRALAIWK